MTASHAKSSGKRTTASVEALVRSAQSSSLRHPWAAMPTPRRYFSSPSSVSGFAEMIATFRQAVILLRVRIASPRGNGDAIEREAIFVAVCARVLVRDAKDVSLS